MPQAITLTPAVRGQGTSAPRDTTCWLFTIGPQDTGVAGRSTYNPHPCSHIHRASQPSRLAAFSKT